MKIADHLVQCTNKCAIGQEKNYFEYHLYLFSTFPSTDLTDPVRTRTQAK